ncbi:MAG: hypothetical protein KC618_09285 [Candidatus Omnitrophica bacterium]|nr:hypothetical protein [Candidatus Omnitrophota bacterium]
MKRTGIYFLILVAFTAAMIGCEQKASNTEGMTSEQMADKVSKAADNLQAKTEKAMKEMDEKVDQMAEEAQKLQAMKDEVMALIEEAKKLLSSENYEDAIAKAKEVLKLDANSAEAKNIIQKAQDALAKMAEEKAAELKEGADQAVSDMKEKLGSFGN